MYLKSISNHQRYISPTISVIYLESTIVHTMEEFVMIGAEALLLPLTPPDKALGGGQQEVQQPDRCQEKEEGWHMDSLASDWAASGVQIKSTRRPSGVVGS